MDPVRAWEGHNEMFYLSLCILAKSGHICHSASREPVVYPSAENGFHPWLGEYHSGVDMRPVEVLPGIGMNPVELLDVRCTHVDGRKFPFPPEIVSSAEGSCLSLRRLFLRA